MTDFIKPLIGIIIATIGVSIVLLGVGLFTGGMNIFSFIGTMALLFLGTGISEVGYLIVVGGDVHESFIFRLVADLRTRQ
jgi:hypothetical protein